MGGEESAEKEGGNEGSSFLAGRGWWRKVGHAPLVWVAVPFTAGKVATHYLPCFTQVSLPLAFVGVLVGYSGLRLATKKLRAAVTVRPSEARTKKTHSVGHLIALLGMCLTLGILAPAYDPWGTNRSSPKSLPSLVEPKGQSVRVRGVLESRVEDFTLPVGPLTTRNNTKRFQSRLRLTSLRQGNRWVPAAGMCILGMNGGQGPGHVGDELEVVGWLTPIRGAGNPDGHPRKNRMAILGTLNVNVGGGAIIVRRRAGFRWSGVIDWIRDRARETIEKHLPSEQHDLARGLLLGEATAFDGAEWERYRRTGVVHAFVISGQHVGILVLLLAGSCRLLQFRQRNVLWFLFVFLLFYTIFTGARPPIRRSVVMLSGVLGGYLLRRVPSWANAFAGAWLIVNLWDPTEMFRTGCQLSFLAVAALYWSIWLFREKQKTRVELLDEEKRPLAWKTLRNLSRWLLRAHLVSLLVWLSVAPLIAFRYHLVSFSGPFIGPWISVCIALALFCGFLLFLCEATFWFFAPLMGWCTSLFLSWATAIVEAAHGAPLSYWYVVGWPEWWVWGHYALVGGLVIAWQSPPVRMGFGYAILVWVVVGLLVPFAHRADDKLRVTFLDVGLGSCVVLELPDGRTLLYDVGAIRGPSVASQQIAPFLWHRGIQRIDEVFLSHADLDHFNGLHDLADRFAIGQVTTTPTFIERDAEGVRLTLKKLDEKAIPIQTVYAGARFHARDVTIRVLHPPANGPPVAENLRSLDLLIEQKDNTILLTGDIEKDGQKQLRNLPQCPVDILMAPHHGSPAANRVDLARWASPKIVVSCQRRRWDDEAEWTYKKVGVPYLSTWEHGAVTVISQDGNLEVNTFRTRKTFTIE